MPRHLRDRVCAPAMVSNSSTTVIRMRRAHSRWLVTTAVSVLISAATAGAAIPLGEVHSRQGEALAFDEVRIPFASDRPAAGDRSLLASVARALRMDSTLRVSVEGHTDWVGVEAQNHARSARRAEAVARMIVNLAGADSLAVQRRISVSGFGESCPIVVVGTPEPEPPPPASAVRSAKDRQALASNNRVEIWQLAVGQSPPSACRTPEARESRVRFSALK